MVVFTDFCPCYKIISHVVFGPADNTYKVAFFYVAPPHPTPPHHHPILTLFHRRHLWAGVTSTPLPSLNPLSYVWSSLFVLPVYSGDITRQISIVHPRALRVISFVKGEYSVISPSKLQAVISVSVQPSLTANRASSEPPTLAGPSTSHPWHLELSLNLLTECRFFLLFFPSESNKLSCRCLL